MFSRNCFQERVKEKFSRMMASKLPCVVPTCHKGEFGLWFELDWTGRPNHSMAARYEVVLAERKLMTYVYAVALHRWGVIGQPRPCARPGRFNVEYEQVRCPKVTFSNRIGYHISKGHITRVNVECWKVTCCCNSLEQHALMFGSWFELDWAGRPNHSMNARHDTYTYIVLAKRKLTTYVYAVGKLPISNI
ncbi:hypothetical protein TIFTF001_026771 [Ficus carica]|uniref:Uncharacterized protein n=1 Tax=Ficus carica TaxID=3494 RepID=A0AA88DMS1_FICCA|nr:hypothetical protein TIFTF001_026771 [Ficus carica]